MSACSSCLRISAGDHTGLVVHARSHEPDYVVAPQLRTNTDQQAHRPSQKGFSVTAKLHPAEPPNALLHPPAERGALPTESVQLALHLARDRQLGDLSRPALPLRIPPANLTPPSASNTIL
jgi:hypothetical protein